MEIYLTTFSTSKDEFSSSIPILSKMNRVRNPPWIMNSIIILIICKISYFFLVMVLSWYPKMASLESVATVKKTIIGKPLTKNPNIE